MASTENLDLYYPDSQITLSHQRDVIAQIQRFGLRRDWISGKEYLSTLSHEDLIDLDIARTAICLHLQHGNFNGAREILDALRLDDSLEAENALLNVRLACLALLAARVRASTDFEVSQALALAKEVDELYFDRNWINPSNVDSEEAEIDMLTIIHQRHLWTINDPTEYDDSKFLISDARVILEDVIAQIMRSACDAGYILVEEILDRQRLRVPPLVKYLRARNRRLLEAGMIFSNYSGPFRIVAEVPKLAIYWQDYLETLTEPRMSIIRACAASQILGFHGKQNLEAARVCFEESSAILLEEGWDNHLAEAAMLKWSIFGDETYDDEAKLGPEAPAVTENAEHDTKVNTSGALPVLRNPIGGDWGYKLRLQGRVSSRRLNDLLVIHQRFLAGHDSFDHLSSSREAIKFVTTRRDLWPRLKPFLDSSLQQLDLFGNRYGSELLHQWYYLEAAEMLQHADEARQYFESILGSTGSRITPDLHSGAFLGLWRSCVSLNLHQRALAVALEAFNSPLSLRNENVRSGCAYRVSHARYCIANDSVKGVQHLTSEQPEILIIKQDIEENIAFLETWIELDRVSGRTTAQQEKMRDLVSSVNLLSQSLGLKEYESRFKELVSSNYSANAPINTADTPSLLPMMLMIREKRSTDAIGYGKKLYEHYLNDKNSSLSMVSMLGTALVGALQAAVLNEPKLSIDTRKTLRRVQYEMITTQLKMLHFEFSAEGYLMRASLFTAAIVDCVALWPEERAIYTQTMIEYFEIAQALCRKVRKGLESTNDVQRWVHRRLIGDKFSFSHLCESAAEFFFRTKNEVIAWSWVQRGRGQALQDMLNDRDTAAQRLLLSLSGDDEIAALLSQDEILVNRLKQADPFNYFEIKQKLERHRHHMRENPVLRQIIDGPETLDQTDCTKLDDIWLLVDYLPCESNIVLVDWFFDATGSIWRTVVNYKDRQLTPRYWRLNIRPKMITEWARFYLRFPNGRPAYLERHWKALYALKELLLGLESVCRPGDLVILSVPGKMAGIPIHGIPLDGKVLIDRNPVIYSAGLSLYRQCLKRARRPSNRNGGGHILKDAIFSSAYEEAGFEMERDSIFSHLSQTSSIFKSKLLLGKDLTVASIREALFTSSWIHYHGHAYYAKTEPLNQCLVLGRLEEEQKGAQTRMDSVEEIRKQFEAQMPFEAKLSDREALLSNHLLKGSSRISVAEIFAMDLSKTHPVVFNMACDSMVQDFASGDDPLGLTSALFCAGASSVVGTLWPIRSSSGRLFSEVFYKNLREQAELDAFAQEKSPRYVLNLALAFREATLAVKKVRPDPYSWAAFVLQGAGFYFYD